MNKYIIIIFFVLPAILFGETTAVPRLTSEHDTLSLVDGLVNACNGKLVQNDKDIEIRGPDPLDLTRYYDGGHHFDGSHGYGVGLCFPLEIVINSTGNLFIEQREGSALVFENKSKKKHFTGKVSQDFLKIGYTNCCEALLRGEADILGMSVEGTSEKITVSLGNGGYREYQYYDTDWDGFQRYRLRKEKRPNGNYRYFRYRNNNSTLLRRISTVNRDESLTLNWIDFTAFDCHQHTATASNGEKVYYCQEKKKGKAGIRGGFDARKFTETLLKKVSGDHLVTTSYDALLRSRYEESLFSVTNIEKPDGRALSIEYDSKQKVQYVSLAGNTRPLYCFEYHSGYTTVRNALGAIKRYDFDKKRLIKLTEPHRCHEYTWSKIGQLLAYNLKDITGKTVIKTDYKYDPNGRIIVKNITGNIKHEGSQDCYTILYTYSQDGSNLITAETHNNEREFTYTYLPGTNLITRKLTFADGRFVEREFYQYDINGIQIQKTIDNGSGPEIDDLSNVSCRIVTETEPQLNPNLPGLTLPRLVKEWAIDPNTNQKHLLKMVESSYTQGDLLAEEKTYDANGCYAFSKCFEYNEKRQLIYETDQVGRKTHYQYDENGNKIYEEILGLNKKSHYIYDKANRLIQEIEEHSDITLTTTHLYDAMGNRTGTTDHFGQTTTYQFDATGHEISSADPYGKSCLKEYDAQGNVIRTIDKDGYATHTLYNISKKPIKITYPDGSTKRFAYNLQQHIIQEWERDGRSTVYEVDYKGRPKVTKTFGADGNLLKETCKMYKGPHLVSETDAMGNATSYAYDKAGRLVKKIQGNQSISYEYDSLGRLAKTTTADSVECKIYDFLDRIVEERVEDLSGCIYKKTQFTYDISGNQTIKREYTDPDHYSETKTVFNSRNLPVLHIDALGNQRKTLYHYIDHLEKETIDPLGRTEVEVYDKLNRLVSLRKLSPDGTLISQQSFRFDGRGNKILQSHTNIFQNQPCGTYEIRTEYDALSQKILETEQNKKTTAYTYNNGRLHQLIKPDGVILTHIYDSSARLGELVSSDGTIHYKYTYDQSDNLLKVEDFIQNTVTMRSYDVFNRIILDKQATETRYTYDSLDRIRSMQFENEKITYNYSPTSLLSASRYKNDNLLFSFTQQTDWMGNPLKQVLPCSLTLDYSWDVLGRCTNIASTHFQQSLIYDKAGNVISTSVDDPLGSYQANFSYDHLDQLMQESGPFNNTYSYDSLHNRREVNGTPYTIEELNQLISTSEENYTYDKCGNRSSKDNQSYSYDALNRLTSVSLENSTIFYRYDSFGRRIASTNGTETITYLYQFDTEIGAIVDGNLIEFKAIDDQHAPFAIELNNKVYAPIKNYRGDICALVDNQGDIVSTCRYDTFGQFSQTGKIKSPWTFYHQRYEEATKLFRFPHRDYDPCIGRWLTPDPLGFADGPNLYAYVHNNPLIYIDPDGLFSFSIHPSIKDSFSEVWHNPRFQGACQMVTGAAEMGAGGAIACGSYGVAAPIGFSVVAHGADQFSTGLRTLVSGRYCDTATSQLLQKTGVSSSTANLIDTSLSMVGTMGVKAIMASQSPLLTLTKPGLSSTAASSNYSPYNRAHFERYKTQLRANMEKPHVYDPKLRRYVESNYKPNGSIGNGSTAAAIRYEKIMGAKVKDKWHSQKGENTIDCLTNWLKHNPTARQGDRAAAENIILDLQNALRE